MIQSLYNSYSFYYVKVGLMDIAASIDMTF